MQGDHSSDPSPGLLAELSQRRPGRGPGLVEAHLQGLLGDVPGGLSLYQRSVPPPGGHQPPAPWSPWPEWVTGPLQRPHLAHILVSANRPPRASHAWVNHTFLAGTPTANPE